MQPGIVEELRFLRPGRTSRNSASSSQQRRSPRESLPLVAHKVPVYQVRLVKAPRPLKLAEVTLAGPEPAARAIHRTL